MSGTTLSCTLFCDQIKVNKRISVTNKLHCKQKKVCEKYDNQITNRDTVFRILVKIFSDQKIFIHNQVEKIVKS